MPWALWVLMNKLQELKFYFSGWNFSALAILLIALVIVLGYTFNVPVGSEEKVKAKVVSLGVTNSSKYSASYSTARVVLANGEHVDVTLPRNIVLQPGNQVVILKQGLFLSGAFYKFGYVPTNP